MTLETIVRVARALEIQVDVVARWRAEGLDRLLDEAHAEIVETLVRRYTAAGWQVAVEVSFAIGGERGSVDVLAFHPGTRIVAVNEVKSVVPDVQAMIHGLDRKSRVARALAAERGWDPLVVSRYLVIGEDRTARRRVAQHDALFTAAFPVRGRAALASIDNPGRANVGSSPVGPGPVAAGRGTSGLIFLSTSHRMVANRPAGGRYRVRSSAPRCP
jgi:hypothetical protein